MRRFLLSAVTILTGLTVSAGAARAQTSNKFNDLTSLLPTQVNAALVIDVQSIYNSPLATKQNWAKDRPLAFSPAINTAAVGAKIDPDDFTGGRWEVGVARLRVRLTMAQIAEREKGALDTIAGAPAVLSARNAYFVELRPWIVGMMFPADRQELGQWVRATRSATGAIRLPDFLRDAVTAVDRDTQFVLAMDLTDSVNPDELRKKIAAVPSIGNIANVDALVKMLAGVQGVKMTLKVDDAIHGDIRFQFAESPAMLTPFAKPMLAEFLARRGAALVGLDDWKVETNGNWLIYHGELPERSYRRVMTLVSPPAPPADFFESSSPLATEIKAMANRNYFNTIQAFLDDLQRPARSTQNDFNRLATWYDSFAQKIEQLPTFNVDEDVVKYGQATAYRLRAVASSLRGDVVDVKKLEQTIGITPYIYAQGGWGNRLQPGIWLQSNQAEVQGQQQQVIQRGIQARQELMSTIQNETDAIAKTIAARYK